MIEWREATPDPWAEAGNDPAGRRLALGSTVTTADLVVHARAMEKVRIHGESSPACEVGGLLLGQVHHDGSDTLIEIMTAVAAPETRGSGVHLAFTPATWTALLAQMADEAPGLMLLGWYHTHPGLGVFMSGTDQHTHGHHFRQPWQVAMVHDPHTGETGCFRGVPAARVSWVVLPHRATRNVPTAPAPDARPLPADWRQSWRLAGILGLRWLRGQLRPTGDGPRASTPRPRQS
ncbi:MAG: Mov34/MPN/PAD-1 family protein [Candidatus Sericytochromatia bacterium]|nr:Mov34/MPN/PAD-1 family protein [Candidatus Tanganyikabacteria bacterium]